VARIVDCPASSLFRTVHVVVRWIEQRPGTDSSAQVQAKAPGPSVTVLEWTNTNRCLYLLSIRFFFLTCHSCSYIIMQALQPVVVRRRVAALSADVQSKKSWRVQ
jgi:hypothetical protein